MIIYPPSLKATGGAHTGIAPVNLLDVQDVNGNIYYWSDRPSNAPVAITGDGAYSAPPPAPVAVAENQFIAWAYPTTATMVGPHLFTTAVMSQMTNNGHVNFNFEAHGGMTASVSFTNWVFRLPSDAVISGLWPTVTGYLGPLIGNQGSFESGIWGSDDKSDVSGTFSASAGDYENSPLSNIRDYIFMPIQLISGSFSNESLQAGVSFVGLCIYYTSISQSGGGGGGISSFLSSYSSGPYIPWLLEVPKFSFHRSLVTDTGAFTLQNLSGDTLSRDFEKIARRSALEGAFFVYRCWQADAQAAWLEVHGTLTVPQDGIGIDTVKLKASQLINASQLDTPLEIYCETCQLQWGGPRCGSTQMTECEYSFQTCQVPERIMVALNSYEKNYGESQANTVLNVINRRRTI
jgi:hypothetical protein